MTESARVRRFRALPSPFTDAEGDLVAYEDYRKLESDRDAQAALVERMRERLVTIRWGIPMSDYHRNPIDALLELPASSALQEFKERCWKQAIEETLAQGGDIENWSNEMLQQQVDEIVAELKKEGR